MLNPLQNAEIFLITILFDLFLFVLMIRFLLCAVGANYFNPITQFVVKCTQWLVAPLRRILPTYKKIEWASLVLIVFFTLLKFFLLAIILIGMPNNFLGLFILSFADILKLLLNTFFYIILIQAMLSWIHAAYSPIVQALNQLSAPILRPFQKIMPPVSGFDLSPIPAMIILQLLIILVANPLLLMGTNLTFG